MLSALEACDVFVICSKFWENTSGSHLDPLELVCVGLIELAFQIAPPPLIDVALVSCDHAARTTLVSSSLVTSVACVPLSPATTMALVAMLVSPLFAATVTCLPGAASSGFTSTLISMLTWVKSSLSSSILHGGVVPVVFTFFPFNLWWHGNMLVNLVGSDGVVFSLVNSSVLFFFFPWQLGDFVWAMLVALRLVDALCASWLSSANAWD